MINAKKQKKTIEWERLEITKGTFHAKMGTIKDRNDRDLTEAKDLKKRKTTEKLYTEKLYKEVLHDPLITMM